MHLFYLFPILAWAAGIFHSESFENLPKDDIAIIVSSKPMEQVSPILSVQNFKCENLEGGGYIAWDSERWSQVHYDWTSSSKWVVLKKRADPDTCFLVALHDEPKDDQYEVVKSKLMGIFKPSFVALCPVKRIY